MKTCPTCSGYYGPDVSNDADDRCICQPQPETHASAPPEIRSTDWMDALEASVASAISHWREFGPEHGFEECVDRLEVRLKAYRWQKESASITRVSDGTNHK